MENRLDFTPVKVWRGKEELGYRAAVNGKPLAAHLYPDPDPAIRFAAGWYRLSDSASKCRLNCE